MYFLWRSLVTLSLQAFEGNKLTNLCLKPDKFHTSLNIILFCMKITVNIKQLKCKKLSWDHIKVYLEYGRPTHLQRKTGGKHLNYNSSFNNNIKNECMH